ncbi:TetR family transcriptional regulator [Dactylosporangium sucinum]|uniref:TetR family transcriptional regulator n=2 Tax=Dactylosporangium sucinum TaxID=1424081 RepID=A0A917TWQ7_9ACTN|nr:TetR family transcriptional regulator [Dactylosporangium sucinum]
MIAYAARMASPARRAELLDQLRDLFLAKGFAAFSIGDLTDHLRCSRTTLYAVAPSKEQIVLAVVRSYFRGAAERIEARVSAAGGPRDRLAVYLDAVAAELQPVSAEFFADLAGFGPGNDIYQENTRFAARRVQRLVVEGVDAGELRPVDASFVGAAAAQVMGAIQRGEIQAGTGLDAAEAYRQLADLVLGSLTAAPSAARRPSG